MSKINTYYNHQEEEYYTLDDPYGNWEHQGMDCPVCYFSAGLLYVESCWYCEGPLVHCPNCGRITCLGTKPNMSDIR